MQTEVITMKKVLRSKPIFVKLSPEEHEKFRKLAVKRHTNLSELIRQMLHREADAKA